MPEDYQEDHRSNYNYFAGEVEHKGTVQGTQALVKGNKSTLKKGKGKILKKMIMFNHPKRRVRKMSGSISNTVL